MKSNTKTILFSVVLGIVCAGVLTTANLYTRPFRIANEEAERALNFLEALGIDVDKSWDAKTMLAEFNKKIVVVTKGAVVFNEYRETDGATSTLEAVAVPFSGAGLWGPVKGVLALEADLKTIRGIRFYQQEETPGLGGEIAADWFGKQFNRKQIANENGAPGFVITKPGGATRINSVDGITGATMTSNAVQVIINNAIQAIWKERNSYVQ